MPRDLAIELTRRPPLQRDALFFHVAMEPRRVIAPPATRRAERGFTELRLFVAEYRYASDVHSRR
jgi:hypothetical protein